MYTVHKHFQIIISVYSPLSYRVGNLKRESGFLWDKICKLIRMKKKHGFIQFALFQFFLSSIKLQLFKTQETYRKGSERW